MKKILLSFALIGIISCTKQNYDFLKVKDYVTVDSIVKVSGTEYNVYATVKQPVDSIQIFMQQSVYVDARKYFVCAKQNPIKLIVDAPLDFEWFMYGISYRGEFYNEGHFFTIKK